MADSCKDIDKALKELGSKIDAQVKCCQENKKAIDDLNNRVKRLERGGNNRQGNDRNIDLTPIYQRLAKIESYINALDATGNALKEGLKQIKELFMGG